MPTPCWGYQIDWSVCGDAISDAGGVRLDQLREGEDVIGSFSHGGRAEGTCGVGAGRDGPCQDAGVAQVVGRRAVHRCHLLLHPRLRLPHRLQAHAPRVCPLARSDGLAVLRFYGCHPAPPPPQPRCTLTSPCHNIPVLLCDSTHGASVVLSSFGSAPPTAIPACCLRDPHSTTHMESKRFAHTVCVNALDNGCWTGTSTSVKGRDGTRSRAAAEE